MCCLIYKPAGTVMPSYDILKACSIKNPDGFGFVSSKRFFKSMSFVEFYKELFKVGTDEDCVIHMRYATHGSVCERNCHPFYNCSTNSYMAHNGVLCIRPIGDMTDSETAFQRFIVPQIKKHGLFSKQVDNVVDNIIGSSKFAIMQNGNVRLFGHYECIDGVYYSNLYFMPLTRRWHDYGYAI